MQSDWQDLIPFYVAGTLNEVDKRRLEAILAESDEARATLQEWQLIGDFVRSEAATWSRGMPPLSDVVRTTINHDVQQSDRATRPNNPPVVIDEVPPAEPPQKVVPFPTSDVHEPRREKMAQSGRSVRIPFTLVAAGLMIILFGGLLFAALLREPDDNLTAAQLLETMTRAVSSTPDGSSTPEPDLGILSVPDEPHTPTPQAEPTDADTVVQRPQPSWTPPPNRCVARAANADVNVYQQAAETVVIDTLPHNEYRSVSVYSDADGGWYELIRLEGGILGWVRADAVILSGPCSDLAAPSPSPTLAETEVVTAGECTVTAIAGVDAAIYETPSRSSAVIQTVADFVAIDVLSTTASGWYRVTYNASDSIWVGYMNEADASFSMACQQLDILPVPSETPAVSAAMDTSTGVEPSLQTFDYTGDEPIRPGETINLTWTAVDAAGVTILFYRGDVDPNDYGVLDPLATFGNLGVSDSVQVVIPQGYTQPNAVYVLFMDALHDDNERVFGGIVTVPVEVE